MDNHGKTRPRIRVQFRQGSIAMKLILTFTITLSAAALITLALAQNYKQGQVERLQAQAAILEDDNRRLQTRIDALGTVQSVQQIAREELGLVDPDTIVFEP